MIMNMNILVWIIIISIILCVISWCSLIISCHKEKKDITPLLSGV